jgi:hypothetical protein
MLVQPTQPASPGKLSNQQQAASAFKTGSWRQRTSIFGIDRFCRSIQRLCNHPDRAKIGIGFALKFIHAI